MKTLKSLLSILSIFTVFISGSNVFGSELLLNRCIRHDYIKATLSKLQNGEVYVISDQRLSDESLNLNGCFYTQDNPTIHLEGTIGYTIVEGGVKKVGILTSDEAMIKIYTNWDGSYTVIDWATDSDR